MSAPDPRATASSQVSHSAQVLGLSELNHPPAPGAAPAVDPARLGGGAAINPLHQVKAKLTVCVGTAELSVGELLGAKDQQVIRLDQTLDHPVEILLEGQVIARGTLVAVDEHFGVRITELPLPLKA